MRQLKTETQIANGLITAVCLMLINSSCINLGEQNYEVPIRIRSSELSDGLVISGSHPFGSPKEKVDYTWRIYAGQGTSKMRVHFNRVTLLGDNTSLKLIDNYNNVLVEYSSIEEDDFWTDEFNCNQIDIRFRINSPTEEPQDKFSIDKVQFTLDPIQWLINDPTSEVIVTGTTPNINLLHSGTSGTGSRQNRESLAVISPGDAHYYVVKGGASDTWDFASIGDGTGAPLNYVKNRDLLLEQTLYGVLKGKFGSQWPEGDLNDDIVVLTRQGEVIISLNRDGYGFWGYHIAHRKFQPEASDVVGCGKMNDDAQDDLILISDNVVRYVFNNGDQQYPQFGSIQTTNLPWDPDLLITPYKTTKIYGDFNNDTWLDIGIIVDIENEPRYGEVGYMEPESTDQILVFLNDQSGGFTLGAHLIDYGLGHGSPTGKVVRSYAVGQFDGDDNLDIFAFDYPGISFAGMGAPPEPLHDKAYLRVAINRYGASDWQSKPFSSFHLGRSYSVSEENFATNQVISGDYNNDGWTDVAIHSINQRRDINRIGVYYSDISPLYGTPHFENVVIWTPTIPPNFGMISGNFINDGDSYPDLLETHSILNRIAVLTNLLDPPYVAEPVERFSHAIDHLEMKPVYKFGDVTGDGRSDLIKFTSDIKGSVEVFESTVDHELKRSDHPWIQEFSYNFESNTEKPIVGDVDGDGYDDLILFASETPTFIEDESFFPMGVFVALNDQSGYFSTPTRWADWIAVLIDRRVPLVDDFDGDGKDDIGIIAEGTMNDVYIALSTGSRFGRYSEHYDWHASFPAAYIPQDYRTSDMNGDNRADLCVVTNNADPYSSSVYSRSYKFDEDGNIISTLTDFAASFEGNVRNSDWLQLGNFSGDQYSDVTMYLTSEEHVENASLKTWFSDEGEGVQLYDPDRRFKGLQFNENTNCFAADIDGDARDEYLMLQSSRYGMKIIGVDISQVDIDIYAKAHWTMGDVGLEYPPSIVPTSDWNRSGDWEFISDELIYNMSSLYGGVTIKVENKGTDAGYYKLIANEIRSSIVLDALFLSTVPIPYDMYSGYRETMEESVGRFLDATDGNIRMKEFILWQVEDNDDLDWWRDHRCEDEVDLYLERGNGRARARHECHMTLFENSGVGTLVHEYGHFGFDIRDEYCEDDSEFGSIPDCPGSPSGTEQICPHSLMSSSSGHEFCTSLNHQRLGLSIHEDPCWEKLTIGSTKWVLKTPNPHNYNEDIFKRNFVIH